MLILETPRLAVRELLMTDAELLYRYSREKTAAEELPDEVLDDVGHARRMIAMFREKYRSREYPLVYAIALKEDGGGLIGHVSLSPIPEGIEIGYAIAMEYQGKGYGQEAVAPFSRWAKGYLGLETLYGLAKVENPASWSILEKAEYRFLGEETRRAWGREVRFRVYEI